MAMIALSAGTFRAAIWIELKPPQEMPNIPTLPFDHAFAIRLLDLGVLIWNQRAPAVAGSADVDGRDHVAALDEVRIERPVATTRLVLAIRQVLEQYREFLA